MYNKEQLLLYIIVHYCTELILESFIVGAIYISSHSSEAHQFYS